MSTPNEETEPEIAGSELAKMFEEASEEPPEQEHDDEEGHAPKRRRRSQHKERSTHELNLTAMMDMMTMILVFLLQNYNSSPETIQLNEQLNPPRSTATIPMDVATTITVTSEALLVNDKPLVRISKNAIVGEPANAPQEIPALKEVLDKQVAEAKRIEGIGGPKFEGKLLVVADARTNYALLMRVLYTSGVAQFSQYKLVVRSGADNQVMNDKKP